MASTIFCGIGDDVPVPPIKSNFSPASVPGKFFEREIAMYLVTATGRQNSVSVGVASAAEALKKVRELEARGFSTVVFDTAGRVRSADELQIRATQEQPKS